MTQPTAEPRDNYSPHLRTALIFAGTGTAGAYHAGVLRALHEAGIKIDIVAGCGAGVPSALFAAIDASAQLYDEGSVWRSEDASRLYRIRLFPKFIAICLAVSLLSVVVPLLAVVAGLLVFPLAFFLGMFGASLGANTATDVVRRLSSAFEPGALPSILPRIAVIGLAVALVALVIEAWRARVRSRQRLERGAFWWAGLGTLLDVNLAIREWRARLWKTIAGASGNRKPDDHQIGLRYTELLSENVGQPGFSELLLVAHDLDARRDVVYALLAERYRADFFGRPFSASKPRSAEAFDLARSARERLTDVLAASLCLPIATDPHVTTFAPESYWRGETHRLVHRPDSIGRLIAEARQAGATQIIVVSATADPPGPHRRPERPGDIKSKIGEYLSTAEGAAVRDAVAREKSATIFTIEASYNPLNALDFTGRYDALSDRHHSLAELIQRGYEDASKQFLEPVVAASGEHITNV